MGDMFGLTSIAVMCDLQHQTCVQLLQSSFIICASLAGCSPSPAVLCGAQHLACTMTLHTTCAQVLPSCVAVEGLQWHTCLMESRKQLSCAQCVMSTR